MNTLSTSNLVNVLEGIINAEKQLRFNINTLGVDHPGTSNAWEDLNTKSNAAIVIVEEYKRKRKFWRAIMGKP